MAGMSDVEWLQVGRRQRWLGVNDSAYGGGGDGSTYTTDYGNYQTGIRRAASTTGRVHVERWRQWLNVHDGTHLSVLFGPGMQAPDTEKELSTNGKL